ncbi:helix-turn-helix transcriptional regulator [Clostridium perfringens]|uniref:helix-turn-helix domain-containing protein n=1 Tax=Clostridium perfringens TaxID=1502 RepID=UPI002245B248|nr:helix-turn-helix transcriptional regulator [Clostridium perfringens]MCX0396963.1 helix-turn-helix transcriptional regulator [Clostridium perfringens]MDK0621632.1 helix-turn-helix transcriptional regulator [Clostridium perfringens]
MAKIKLEKLLKEHNKSLYWLAEETGISYPTLHKLSKNKTVSANFNTLEAICNVLDCDLNDLIELDNKEKHGVKPLYKKINK